MGIVVIGAVFVDIKGCSEGAFIVTSENVRPSFLPRELGIDIDVEE